MRDCAQTARDLCDQWEKGNRTTVSTSLKALSKPEAMYVCALIVEFLRQTNGMTGPFLAMLERSATVPQVPANAS